MKTDLPYLTTMARRVGKTTAICKAAKEIGATVVVHSREEARRVEHEHGVRAATWDRLRGSKGPYLVDTHAVSVAADMYESAIHRTREQLALAVEALEHARYCLLHKLNLGFGCEEDIERVNEALAAIKAAHPTDSVGHQKIKAEAPREPLKGAERLSPKRGGG
jgi:hypothetical protein